MLIADNITHFARVLRTAGLQVGPDRVLTGIAAVQAVGLDRRDDVRAALAAVMLDRHEQQVIFDAAFDAFFRDPKLLEQLMYALLPKISGRGESTARRATTAWPKHWRRRRRRRHRHRPARRRQRKNCSSRPASPSPTANACSGPISRP
jgi:uncharacterized protein with von Willebrand factor type A (vWA) domain